jgi:hypothetical protein
MAAPHVTGAVALVAAAAPSLDGLAIKRILFETVHPVPNLFCATGGRLDVNAAVRLAIEETGGDGGGGEEEPEEPEEPEYDPPSLTSVQYLKKRKTLVVEGAQFREGTSVIEVDGVAMPVNSFPAETAQTDGTFTRIEGKAPGRIKFFLPRKKTVLVTIYDTMTRLRSAPVSFRR